MATWSGRRGREGGAFAERVGKQRKRPLEAELEGLVVGRRSSSVAASSAWPKASRLPQRWMLATQSLASTALPSWNLRPAAARSSTICRRSRWSRLPPFAGWRGSCRPGHRAYRTPGRRGCASRRRRPDRVEHGKIRLGREFHDALTRGERERRRGKRRRDKRCRGGSFQEISSAQFILPARRFDRSNCAREMAPVEGEPDDLISEEGKTQAESKAWVTGPSPVMAPGASQLVIAVLGLVPRIAWPSTPSRRRLIA